MEIQSQVIPQVMPNVLNRRYDFVFLFDVENGNPNGDPDAGNLPRMDPQTLHGIVTDVCIKRKIRNAIRWVATDLPGYDIYFQTQDAAYDRRVLNLLHKQAYDVQAKTKPQQSEPEDELAVKLSTAALARQWMCQQYFDVRTFGAVMSTGEFNCGQVRGPVQITFSRSIDPIVPMDLSITRKSVTTEADAQKQVDKHGSLVGTMGRKSAIPYALYRGHGFVSAQLARGTGFSRDDLRVLFRSIQYMFQEDRSASRGLMSVRGLHVFEHASALGEAPSHLLFDKIITKSLGTGEVPRSFSDYRDNIAVDCTMPTGVTYHDLTTAAITEETFAR